MTEIVFLHTSNAKGEMAHNFPWLQKPSGVQVKKSVMSTYNI